jgi:hypothetical protein
MSIPGYDDWKLMTPEEDHEARFVELEWNPISSAPKDQQIIIYMTRFGEIGQCQWSQAAYDYEESIWLDIDRDDECSPLWWLPRSVLPPMPSA